MKNWLLYLLVNTHLILAVNTINPKYQNFEGSIEFNYTRNGEIFRIDKHFFSEKNYGITSLYFKMNFDLGDLVFDLEKENRVLIKHSTKTIQNLGIEKQRNGDTKSEIIMTDQFTEILGHKCRKYILKKYSAEFYKTTISWLWIAEDLKFQKLNKIAKITADNSSISAIHTMSEGIPLRIDLLNENNEKMSYLEATKIDRTPISKEFFNIPEGYKTVTG
uniref:DUF4412 domain-containing protein n=1 Tax=Roseivirga sp. TaxID=1964215 RepID=UPI00404845CA